MKRRHPQQQSNADFVDGIKNAAKRWKAKSSAEAGESMQYMISLGVAPDCYNLKERFLLNPTTSLMPVWTKSLPNTRHRILLKSTILQILLRAAKAAT